ncbi:3-oxoacid CoA-transferase subunit B [Aquibaculum arenosum]|uniref:3-oxoacid CoA-transferase subunit B n=1 Tax=Aquibaculum arenosum TaxID=3032591 RepID=A0ABT5YQ30_9PROT|nr:3-oxoacid CoA-transferase subunit B [Fodinicurvata sp. CAU 1616]MDF2097078.1 3-oxoacid CoA-transferase subunit B [Fodinicurvata sp. CAU 1616]
MSETQAKRLGLSRKQMAWRAAQDLQDGAVVNLGIGMPELVASYVPDGRELLYHSENGLLGFGPPPPAGQEDPELINAGKKPVTLLPGASFFHHADSFAMIRGGHIDVCILGAMQVAANGDIANWSTGAADAVPAVGGAMDLVAGARAIWVLSEHTTRDGAPKLVEQCSYPLTGQGVVRRIYSNLGLIEVSETGFRLLEIAPGISVEELRALTGAPLEVPDSLPQIDAPEL